jgi:Ni,Fe-hydrogenase III small subunit/Pyruvate/2-oxoacid:ferredoxin oxidoreductase delta subunit
MEPTLPARFRGLPTVDYSQCPATCKACVDVCPTDAITIDGSFQIDVGRCLFCPECADACPEERISFSREYRLATSSRSDLLLKEGQSLKLAHRLSADLHRILGRSLKLRQVSAGGCNGCEADVNVLNTVVYDLGRFGIEFVASPRHADGLLITGPVTRNMHLALEKTYAAVPHPKIVIAVGACAISGGPFRDHPEVLNGASNVVRVDLFIPGCPPHPITILDGLLRLIGRIDSSMAKQDRNEAPSK